MPESYGKRQRGQVKAKKANAREERRIARNRRRSERKEAPTGTRGGDEAPVEAIDHQGGTEPPGGEAGGQTTPSDQSSIDAAEPARPPAGSEQETGPERTT